MRVLNKLGTPGQIKSVILRDSRVEVEMEDGSIKNFYLSEGPTELDKDLVDFFHLVKNKELDSQDRVEQLGSKAYVTDPVKGTKRAILSMVKDLKELYRDLEQVK